MGSARAKETVILNIAEPDQDQASPVTPVRPIFYNARWAKSSQLTSPSLTSPEAQLFLAQLDNYIPVGCLVGGYQCQQHNRDETEWCEIVDTAELAQHSFEHFVVDVQKLITHGWVRVHVHSSELIWRVYVLPSDIGHRFVDHQNKSLSRALYLLIRELDVSPEAWEGRPYTQVRFDPSAALEEGSLYYTFNTLPSPSPSPTRIKSYFRRAALKQLLHSKARLPGLRTSLYQYQRRSAGLMLQRESEAELQLDPRLEQRIAPNGLMYFYGPRDTMFLRSPRFYETCRGGILAETMGLGKTLICVALILSTKGCMPKVPVQYTPVREKREREHGAASLTDMAAASIYQHSAPWSSHFESIARSNGEYMASCINIIRRNAPVYEIPVRPVRWNRKTTTPPPKRLMLASTTLVVVPRNLFNQWKAELEKHIEPQALHVLLMDDSKKALPSPQDLALYDVILFSRTRFEQESRDGTDSQGRRRSRYPVSCKCPYIGATRTRDCICLREEDLYDSPLKHIHFLRIITDEGHSFSSSATQAARVANEMVCADHRWVVSGTPAKDLLGVEMDLMAAAPNPNEDRRLEALDLRKDFGPREDTSGAIASLGELVTNFLQIQPWTASKDEKSAEWKYDIYRYTEPRSKVGVEGFSKALRRTLENIVVKTQPEDVERDIELPPLEHRIIRLKPSLYDKITANAFVLSLTANAITSERTDADYLFHSNSRDARNQLIYNLRQSAFSWTGFSESDISAVIKNSEGYLSKENAVCTEDDRSLLLRCVAYAKDTLNLKGWKALSRSHEIGLFVDHWPEQSAQFWTFDDNQHPLLCGVSQLLDAQSHVNKQTNLEDPSEGLPGAGIRALAPTRLQRHEDNAVLLVKSGVPNSSIKGQPSYHKLTSAVGKLEKSKSPQKTQVRSSKLSKEPTSSQPVMSCSSSATEKVDMDADSPLRETIIIGTTSSKLSYLLSKISELHTKEKILVFYDGDNTAYYIAQALELLHITHLIYAKSLTAARKSEYIVMFDQESTYRVLLMDIRQAAFGLNVSSASRVFFVNPVCRPQVEAQAIKRAHRIGQSRPVVVETLILQGTMEEKMLERSQNMTRAEHAVAKMLDDDGGIKEIIQSAMPLPIADDEWSEHGQVALLAKPEQLWARTGWTSWKNGSVAPAECRKKRAGDDVGEEPSGPRKEAKLGKVSIVDDTNRLGLETLTDVYDWETLPQLHPRGVFQSHIVQAQAQAISAGPTTVRPDLGARRPEKTTSREEEREGVTLLSKAYRQGSDVYTSIFGDENDSR